MSRLPFIGGSFPLRLLKPPRLVLWRCKDPCRAFIHAPCGVVALKGALEGDNEKTHL
jgi:hypothetical protein